MQEHYLQKDILHKLVLSDKARFADLRPKGIDSNVFTYHLKQLITQKLVEKTNEGYYILTPLGRVAGINVTLTKKELLEQAHSVLLMCLKTDEGWLLRKRLAQPMYEKIGFVHAEPVANKTALQTATETFKERTGLTCDFSVRGAGYVRLMRSEHLESFVHFTLFFADSYTGNLINSRRNGENAWYRNPDFNAENMIPSMNSLAKQIESSDTIFFEDLTYDIS